MLKSLKTLAVHKINSYNFAKFYNFKFVRMEFFFCNKMHDETFKRLLVFYQHSEK